MLQAVVITCTYTITDVSVAPILVIVLQEQECLLQAMEQNVFIVDHVPKDVVFAEELRQITARIC